MTGEISPRVLRGRVRSTGRPQPGEYDRHELRLWELPGLSTFAYLSFSKTHGRGHRAEHTYAESQNRLEHWTHS